LTKESWEIGVWSLLNWDNWISPGEKSRYTTLESKYIRLGRTDTDYMTRRNIMKDEKKHSLEQK
jgi:hypothetical protein